MALDKLVDSSQLDSDLTSVANAIRTKGGTSAQLAFPQGFVDAVEAIETGGGEWTTNGIADGTEPNGAISISGTKISPYVFYGRTGITSVNAPNVTSSADSAFYNCSNLVSVNLPKMKGGNSVFRGCKKLTSLHLPSWTGAFEYGAYDCSSLESVYFSTTSTNNSRNLTQAFRNCTKLKTVDFGTTPWLSGGNIFQGDSLLDTLILRRSSIQGLSVTNAFTGTKFASGGAGGKIFIPKSLYDHLGDGSSLDYEAATNWSVVNGYGTITWAQIEGSIYETQYGDGTPIPTT